MSERPDERPEERPVERPLLRVVRGTPDDVELAALTAVIAAGAAGGGEQAGRHRPRSRWADREALLRKPLTAGPGAWRAAGFPR